MAKSLIAPTEDFIKPERTILDADAAAGDNVALTVQDNDHFVENDYIVIGREGAEQTEIVQINSAVTAGQSIQVDTLKFAHKANVPVTKYKYNQRKFYGSETATGTFVELTAYGSPANIQVDDPQGTLLEYTGVEGYEYFKATYFNEETSEETNMVEEALEFPEQRQFRKERKPIIDESDPDLNMDMGVKSCPHCGSEVPDTIYCINCGKSLDPQES